MMLCSPSCGRHLGLHLAAVGLISLLPTSRPVLAAPADTTQTPHTPHIPQPRAHGAIKASDKQQTEKTTEKPSEKSPEKPQQSFSVPFTPLPAGHGGPLVHLRVNGKEEGAFAVDTGAGANLITDELVTKLDLKTHPVLQGDGKPYEPYGTPIPCVNLDKLTFPVLPEGMFFNVNLTNAIFGVVSHDQTQMGPNFSVDGFLGLPFLREWAVCFDFPAHIMKLIDPGSLSAAQVNALGFGGSNVVALPLSPCNGTFFSVPATIGSGSSSRRVDLEIDTGAASTYIPLEAARALSLKYVGYHEIAGGSAGHRVLEKVQVPSLSLGSIQLTDVTMTTVDNLATPAPILGNSDPTPAVGMDLLKNYRVLIDFPARMMYIQPTQQTGIGIPSAPSLPSDKQP